MKESLSSSDISTSKKVAGYWRAIRSWWLFRWLFFTVVDGLSCMLFAVQYFVYAKPACPISTVSVPPSIIKNSIESTKFVHRRLYWFSGLVVRRDWDPIKTLRPKHRILVDQFIEGFAADNSQERRQGRSELVRYQSLFELLSSTGFAVPTWRDRTTDPFCLSIGANGEFLYMTGKHRLALAEAAGVKAIPARISARHWKWQAYRDELYRNGVKNKVSLAQLDAIGHPDLQDVILAVRRAHAKK